MPAERQASESADTPPAAEQSAAFPIVGVGASAGGLEALSQLLRALPEDTGMGFVIVQHLSPTQPSSLAEILSRQTKMPVCEVRDEPLVLPNHVYVIPPGRNMSIKGGKLQLLPREQLPRPRGIDQFFRGLAADCKHKAIGVVLSGALNDGTVGLEEIKAEGGITFAQDDSAQHSSMPLSAVATGCVDFVLAPAQIAAEIARIAHHPYVEPAAEEMGVEEAAHTRIVQILREATGVDFTHYKSNTLHRRIKRRMVMLKLENLKDYEAVLQDKPEEVQALHQDILISVTTFFRDPKAFEVLVNTVFPKLLTGRSPHEPLRLWTLGCSSGEEAYSLAIAFTECAEKLGSAVPLQIFATDVNEEGVRRARLGLYPASIAHDVSAERLERFFMEEEDGYRISKSIRERCVFSPHNVLADPPFSRMDFISCRNMLIYMQPVLQQEVLPLLHYALKPGGFLWLGSSETPGTSRALFEVEDLRHKIFVRRPGSSPPGTRYRPAVGASTPNGGTPITLQVTRPQPRVDLNKEAERLLLTKFTPPAAVISASMEILQFRGDTALFMSPASGAASLNLLKMLREGLMVGVRSAIVRAGETGKPAREEGLRVNWESGPREINVQVLPIRPQGTKEHGFLVLFEEIVRPPPAHTAQESASHSASMREELAHLTQELAATREYLQSVIEQHEAANEELQSINEEAQSANEEMQSVNEELETSKEEIQASYEELHSVNAELNSRNLDLGRVNSSLRLSGEYALSIIDSMRGPLVVLDEKLRVKTASGAFYRAFRVPPTATEGRLIYDLGNGQWNIPELRRLLEDILPKDQVVDDFEVRHTFEHIGPRVMMLNARRLPQGTDATPLIVLAFEDVTQRTDAVEKMMATQERMRLATEATGVGIWEWNILTNQIHWDAQMFRLYGVKPTPDGMVPYTTWSSAVLSEDLPAQEASLQETIQSTAHGSREFRIRRANDGECRHLQAVDTVRLNAEGRAEFVVGSNLDVTTRKQKEAELQASEKALAERVAELARADRSKDEFLAMLAHELRNPLAPLRNAAEILQAEAGSPEERQHAQHIIVRQIENMSRLIDDLLDVSRITHGKIELKCKPVALEAILTAAADMVRPGCATHHQELTVIMPQEPVYLDADATRLEQVFGNLLSNACKYSGDGCHIVLRAERSIGVEPPQVLVSVRDNGIGISAELLPHIFDLFVQSTRALDRAHGGLGIGLTLVHRIVTLHGGSIEARSDGLGQGSEFIVRLPIMREPPPPPALPPAATLREPPRRILIVDDNIDSARSLAMLQRRRGHETCTAFTGPEALTAAAEFKPEVVLLDIGLPGMDGFEVARRLRAMPELENLLLIAMSGYGSADDRTTAKLAGFDEYLVKPIDFETLRSFLRQRA